MAVRKKKENLVSMEAQWTREAVEALAPDANSLKNGEFLATDRKWQIAGVSEYSLWGECKGSGKKPYLTAIDLREPAFKCSCPSRKFPCKHSLGLFLLYVDNQTAFSKSQVPDWVGEWLAKRDARADKKAEKLEVSIPEARGKNEAQRIGQITEGISELKLWLYDAVRLGTAELYQQPESYWQEKSARMVDAKAPGIATRIQKIAEHFSRQNWQHHVLEELGSLYLLAEGFSHLNDLPPELQEELKNQVGINVKKETVLQQRGIKDVWLVLGKKLEIQDRVDMQKTWLLGKNTGHLAVIIDFAFGNQGFETNYLPGTGLEAELVYYPGSVSMRALLKDKPLRSHRIESIQAWPDLDSFFETHARILSRNPFLYEYPFLVEDLRPVNTGQVWHLMDKQDQYIPIVPRFAKIWELFAISAGEPVTVFGEWNGRNLYPLGVWHHQRWIHL